MKAMLLEKCRPVEIGSSPLREVEIETPQVKDDEVRIRIAACGVCHTELDEIEGRTMPQLPVVPGHEVIGRIDQCGDKVSPDRLGERVGVGWIHHSSGDDGENISPRFVATGRDVNGGYAEYMVVPSAYALAIPDAFDDAEAAPLLCAGSVGYRALKLTRIENGQKLGLTGFGGSAHIVLQLAKHLYPDTDIYVFARDAVSRKFAMELGAKWCGSIEDDAPVNLDSIIDTTPAWKPVVCALQQLAPGGRLVINAIRKQDNDKQVLTQLNYHEHLWMEKEIKSVANVTRGDIEEFLGIAAEIPIHTEITTYPLSQANQALVELKHQPVRGAKVLLIQ